MKSEPPVLLGCRTHFSLLEGASSPEEIVRSAAAAGYRTIAITDTATVGGIVQAHEIACETGISLIIGTRLALEEGDHFLLLAKNRSGYAALCRIITKGRLRGEKGTGCYTRRDLLEDARDLVLLWLPSLAGNPSPFKETKNFIRGLFLCAEGDLYIAYSRHFREGDAFRERLLRALASELGLHLVPVPEVFYHRPERRRLQDLLTAVRLKRSLDACGRALLPNDSFFLPPPSLFLELYADVPSEIRRTQTIAQKCTFSLEEISHRYPKEAAGDRESLGYLRELTFQGGRERFPEGLSPEMVCQVERELALIGELNYADYFLTMYDIVRFCRREGILCQGRGSAANSTVCYLLGITAVDPVRMDLLFERFLSRERAEPPDIDLDIEHKRREEVIQYVYRRYGRERAAMVGCVIRFRTRQALRDTGRAFSFSEDITERLIRAAEDCGGIEPGIAKTAGLEDTPRMQAALQVAAELLRRPRHLSIHPGGFLIGRDPVSHIVPIENAAMPDRTVIQWDKDDLESLDLFKVDLLGLGALTQIRMTLELVRKHYGRALDLSSIPPEDPSVYAMLRKADTVGVFQLESRAQMNMLPRLKPRTFFDLVVEISLIRPGPITGGMVHPYLRRRNGLEPVSFPHPCLEPVLKKTLGVPLFQEQVMKLAVVAADYSPGEADQLRRDMAAWRKNGRIDRHRERLLSRMKKKGIPEEFALRIFEQIRGFGEYGFPESHAAGFALLAYAAAYLKRYFPAAFTCALLNAQPMGFYSPATIINDARRHGITVLPVSVTRSFEYATLERLPSGSLGIRLGLDRVRALPENAIRSILEERNRQPFGSLEDFAARTRLNRDHLAALARAGALAPFEPDRKRALWIARRLARTAPKPLALPEETLPLFAELREDEEVLWDYHATDCSPRNHPLAFWRKRLHQSKVSSASHINATPPRTRVRFAGFVICRQRPPTAKGTVFLTLEDETGLVNVLCRKTLFEQNRFLVKYRPFLGVTGRIQKEGSAVQIIAEEFWSPEHTKTTK
ncbi:MAG: DNA polymerase III subunit alpha [Candidatus Hydrogenedentota bacterium]|nr:MAG: DNA polymerase III subunit alpha [Candidatus Hydrogenedentota bacterium]